MPVVLYPLGPVLRPVQGAAAPPAPTPLPPGAAIVSVTVPNAPAAPINLGSVLRLVPEIVATEGAHTRALYERLSGPGSISADGTVDTSLAAVGTSVYRVASAFDPARFVDVPVTVTAVAQLVASISASEGADTATVAARAFNPSAQTTSNAGGSMIDIYRGDTSRAVMFEMRDSTNALMLSASPTVFVSKAGSVFAPAQGNVFGAGSGRYAYWPTAEDVNTEGLLVIVAKAAGAVDSIVQATVVQRYGRR